MSKVLLVGGSGQLGIALGAAFRGSELISTSHRTGGSEYVPLDLGSAPQIDALLEHERPQLILVAGAMCHVDLCEQEPALCYAINVAGPKLIAQYAARTGARVAFFSTDHVFDGANARYGEDDVRNPLSVYAQSKMHAEDAIRSALPDGHLILRTGWVYGPDNQRRNFILRLVDRLRRNETVDVPNDQYGCPSYTDDIAQAAKFLVDAGSVGTFHAVGPEAIDRVTLARRVCERFSVNAGLLRPVRTRDLGQIAARSLSVILDCRKLHALGAPAFRSVDAGIDALALWSETLAKGAR